MGDRSIVAALRTAGRVTATLFSWLTLIALFLMLEALEPRPAVGRRRR